MCVRGSLKYSIQVKIRFSNKWTESPLFFLDLFVVQNLLVASNSALCLAKLSFAQIFLSHTHIHVHYIYIYIYNTLRLVWCNGQQVGLVDHYTWVRFSLCASFFRLCATSKVNLVNNSLSLCIYIYICVCVCVYVNIYLPLILSPPWQPTLDDSSILYPLPFLTSPSPPSSLRAWRTATEDKQNTTLKTVLMTSEREQDRHYRWPRCLVCSTSQRSDGGREGRRERESERETRMEEGAL